MAVTLRIGVVAALMVLAVAAWTRMRVSGTPPMRAAIDTTYGLGEVVTDFAFADLDGRQWTLTEYAAGVPTVLVMRDAMCPVSRRYGPTTQRLQQEFGERGVRFLYVNVSPLDSHDERREDHARYGFSGVYAHDPDWIIARLLRVITTGEVFLVDADRRLRYRGAIDDQYGIRFTKPQPRSHYLRDAMEAMLAGDGVARRSTLPEGCYLAAEVRSIEHDHDADMP